jgi:hypothetical protein
MHPFALYLAATDIERNYGGSAKRKHASEPAPVEAVPLGELAPVSRFGRLTSIIRRWMTRATTA